LQDQEPNRTVKKQTKARRIAEDKLPIQTKPNEKFSELKPKPKQN